jgi:hypothetical protein
MSHGQPFPRFLQKVQPGNIPSNSPKTFQMLNPGSGRQGIYLSLEVNSDDLTSPEG